RARIGLARGLLSGRPVLLLDEPVGHLDHATAEAVLGALTGSTTGQSVVMASHRPEGLAGFDRVIDLSRQTGDPDRAGGGVTRRRGPASLRPRHSLRSISELAT